MASLINRILGSRFEYDALKGAGKRKQAATAGFREDTYTKGAKHRQLQGNAADLARNLSLASWMVRRHLDYVSQFEFRPRNENESIDEQLEQLMLEDSTPQSFDVAGKFGREKMFRLAEHRRVLDGDTLLVKLADGRLQGLQADLLRDPDDVRGGDTWITGVKIDSVGRPLKFGIYGRQAYTGVNYVRQLDAANCIHYGFFERYAADQVRGVSPIVAALNPLRDVYENFNYALLKAKVSQLFALAFMREGEDSPFAIDDDLTGSHDPDADHVAEPRGFQAFVKSDTRYVDMAPGEKVEVIESRTPSSEFQSFTNLVIQVALKALDIPYSFYDESHTNFFGSRAAWLHYERSCKDKRDDQIAMRQQYTSWKLALWVQSGRLTLPTGMQLSDIRYEWVPRGMPWWDPAKEIAGQVQAIAAGLDTPQRICKMTGSDYYENIEEIAKASSYADGLGVQVTWEPGSSVPTRKITSQPADQEMPEDDIDSEA